MASFIKIIGKVLLVYVVLVIAAALMLLYYYLTISWSIPSKWPVVVSVSSDGEYAVSSGRGKNVTLWDIKNKKVHVISHHANIYSAYFIKNTHNFIWQDLNDIVHVQNVDGKELMSFHSFPSYGEAMTSDLQYYFASDIDWNLYQRHNGKLKIMNDGRYGGGFMGAEKLLNLTLSNNNRFLLSSGYDLTDIPLSAGTTCQEARAKGYDISGNCSLLDEITLWNVKTGTPVVKFTGNMNAKLIATLNPDGTKVVAGDEDDFEYVWEALTGQKIFQLDNLYLGKSLPRRPGQSDQDWELNGNYDTTGLIKHPKDFNRGNGILSVIALKFIDNTHYLRFTTYEPKYTVLYDVASSLPLKYLRIPRYPEIAVSDYSRDQAIDTAPAAHILVMGQQYGDGIVVYKYDPTTQTIHKIWTPYGTYTHLLLLGFVYMMLAVYLTDLAIRKNIGRHWIIIYFTVEPILLAILAWYAFNFYWVSVGLVGFALAALITVKKKQIKTSST